MHKKIMTVLLVLIFMLTTACSINIGGDRLNVPVNLTFDREAYMTEEQNIARNAADIGRLEITGNIGNIAVKGTASEDISIKAVKKVNGTNEEMKKEIMQNIDIIIENSGNILSIHPATKDGKGDDLWKWVEQLYKGAQVTVDFELEVPENIKAYAIRNNTGNISLSNISGEIDAKNSAGNIDLNGVSLTGESDIQTNTGNICIESDLSSARKLYASIMAGNITLKLPESSGFDLTADTKAGNLNGSFLSGPHINSGSYKQSINGGGVEVNVTTGAGNVTIDSK